jgi:ribosomal-protein-serine acetyltransferase
MATKSVRPLLIELPFPIQTRRLTLRPPQPGDGPELNAAVRESQERLKHWMPWARGELPSQDDSEENVRRAHAQYLLREDLRISMFDRTTGKMIGNSGLHRFDWEARTFEIGYWVRTGFEGQGYVTEAVTAITQYAFRQLKAARVEIRCDVENHRSAAIPRKLGYQLEAVLKKNALSESGDGNHRDTMVFARFDTEGLPDVGASW